MLNHILPALARVRLLSSQVGTGAAAAAASPAPKPASINKGAFAVAGGVGLAAFAYYYWSASNPKSTVKAMDQDQYTPYQLREIQKLNHNTAIYRFNLNNPKDLLELPTCSFVLTKVDMEGGKTVERPYTPIGSDVGYFDLLVKTYKEGVMSSHIASLKPGDSLDVRGPINKYLFTKANQHSHIGLIAGGTGITPMLQVINKVLQMPNDSTKLTLIFGNLSEQDILLKEKLDALRAKYPNRLNIVYSVNKPDSASTWKGEVGVLNKSMLAKHLPKPTESNIKVFICGPPPMVKAIAGSKAPDYSQGDLNGVLKEMGYTAEQVYKF